MIKNYFKTAWRNLWKNKAYSFLNIFGLAVASIIGITGLLSKDFLRLVFISSVIAFPLSWWFMHKWLQNYQYRIAINWWVFVLAALLALLIALITISFQSVRAAVANPVKSLRTE